ncbi:LexA family transcriptional regulator [Enterococcus durans]|uniref:LexA family transcriptional regulator n=1 Tax=Enterococcus durans TaxID=53345 RepID=A0A5N0YM92_9ENTE|nr:LexA family transcriptional regulator [Enterococcus durans]KAA9190812.1 LexA family transcriptional regulator [Enterococcus durans]KAA9203773.1 LexA family transcriptional regulator [Enterococcus durans]
MGTQISLLRKKFGLTQEDLANKLGFSKQTISNWETGLKTPRMGAIQKIADLFNVSKSFIIEGIEELPSTSIEKIYNQLTPPRQQKVYDFAKHELEEQQDPGQNNKIHSLQRYRELKEQKEEFVDIDWYGCASAGTGEFIFDTKEVISLPKKQIPIEADFCLTVNGDSMEPVIYDQDYIFVSKQDTLFNGNVGVVIVDGEAFIKKVFFENDKARLQSFNKKYKDIIVDDSNDFRIIGKVVL